MSSLITSEDSSVPNHSSLCQALCQSSDKWSIRQAGNSLMEWCNVDCYVAINKYNVIKHEPSWWNKIDYKEFSQWSRLALCWHARPKFFRVRVRVRTWVRVRSYDFVRVHVRVRVRSFGYDFLLGLFPDLGVEYKKFSIESENLAGHEIIDNA